MTVAGCALLVVDDNEDNRYTLTRRLQREGYTDLTAAVDGGQALDLLARRRFDLVLLDVMMPVLNGYEVLERMRADPRLRDVPVIMISANDELDSVIRCIELGAEDYLSKPFNAALLRARVSASLEKKRLRDQIVAVLGRLERELKSAREVQLGMVPVNFSLPAAAGDIDIFATLEPAREIGGDLYDFFWGDDARLYFVIADVSDKGAPAALFMARTKTMIRLVATLTRGAEGGELGPDEIIRKVNEELCVDNREQMFVTVFCGILDPKVSVVTFCNAGHNPPYLINGSGVTVLDGARSKPLGIRPTFHYGVATYDLTRGDSIFLFTDGITEALNEAGDLFSEERLVETLRRQADATAKGAVQEVVAAVREFSGTAPQADDIAAMLIRYNGLA
jgi:sigma-B regulation protein RsbU (phosphoserine phosphatase)